MRRREFIGLAGAAAVYWPAVLRAQQPNKLPTVAYLWHAGNAAEEEPYFSAIVKGFAKLGYVDGRNIKLIHRFPNEIPERFASMAAVTGSSTEFEDGVIMPTRWAITRPP